MKTIVGKVRRSRVCYLMDTATPVNAARKARSDIWGAVAVVILLLAVFGLVRFFLTA